MRFSYHTHTDFCDGHAAAASMARAAYDAGYSVLGFSSHAPLPFKTEWNMEWDRMEEYARTIRGLDETWRERGMAVLLGLEIDYIEGLVSPADESYGVVPLDFRIGSIHYLRSPAGERFAVDGPGTDFARHMAAGDRGRNGAQGGGNPDRSWVWQDYYRGMAAMARRGGFDIVGHFDIVRKNNADGRWFDESSHAYVDAAFGAIDEVARAGLVVEINTGGVARGKNPVPYPSLPLLRRMREKGIRCTIGDDAHRPRHLGAYQDMAVECAKAAGYGSLWYLGRDTSWREIGIGEVGSP